MSQYKELAVSNPKVPLAGGEGCNNFVQTLAMIDYSGVAFIQIDAGRIGGITTAKRVADLAATETLLMSTTLSLHILH